MKLSWQAQLYRAIFKNPLAQKLLGKLTSPERLEGAILKKIQPLKVVSHSNDVSNNGVSCPSPFSQLAWFHAASEGELECLWPVIVDWAHKKKRLVITIFSESALKALERLKNDVSAFPDVSLISGFSPWEGHWEEALQSLKPSVFVTVKYEAWPDLWMSLSMLEIPLVILGAKARRSFDFCQKVLKLCSVPLPRIFFLTADQAEVRALEQMFSSAFVREAGEPRWDRVKERSLRENPRVLELFERFGKLPRPWGILGQVWREDLGVWQECLSSVSGTVWVVPHRVDPVSVEEVSRFLDQLREKWVRTSVNQPLSEPVKFIFLDEMGVLSELYRYCDWAYIGGGFGKGVHSTIEPAIHGIPVAAGPAGAQKFSEILQLVKTGQLTLVKGQSLDERRNAIQQWVGQALAFPLEQKQKWAQEAQGRVGATRKVMHLLLEIISRSGESDARS